MRTLRLRQRILGLILGLHELMHAWKNMDPYISFRNTHFLRTLLLGLLSPNGNGRGICIRTDVYLSMYKINFDSYVSTAPLGTVPKLECGIPALGFTFVIKKLGSNIWYVRRYASVYLVKGIFKFYIVSILRYLKAIFERCIAGTFVLT